jgi:hypothetical protein
MKKDKDNKVEYKEIEEKPSKRSQHKLDQLCLCGHSLFAHRNSETRMDSHLCGCRGYTEIDYGKN